MVFFRSKRGACGISACVAFLLAVVAMSAPPGDAAPAAAGKCILPPECRKPQPRKVTHSAIKPADCEKLPPLQELEKKKMEPSSIRGIQLCLRNKGFYSGPLDGVAGPLTRDALALATGGGAAPGYAQASGRSYTVFRLTAIDLEDLKTRKKVADKLEALRGNDFDTHYNLLGAMRTAIEEAAPPSVYVPVAVKQAKPLSNLEVTQPFLQTLSNSKVPPEIVSSVAQLQGQHFDSRQQMEKALAERVEAAAPSEYYLRELVPFVDESDSSLEEDFYEQLEKWYLPEDLLAKVQELEDVEFPTRPLFTHALAQVGAETASGSDTLRPFTKLLVRKAEKKCPWREGTIRWEGGAHGCGLQARNGMEIYGIYPFWSPGEKQVVDFSILTRIGYFGVTFDNTGALADPLDWAKERADFINKARQYWTSVDLVVYRNNWRGFDLSGQNSMVVDKLSSSIAAAVNEKLDRPLLNTLIPYLTLGFDKTPAMGDGVTIFFDNYPAHDGGFLKELLVALRRKLGGNRKLNLVLSMADVRDEMRQKLLLEEGVDLFLVLLEQPTSVTKKEVRSIVEKLAHGKNRVEILRKILPVVSSNGHQPSDAAKAQLKDDIWYFEDNFGGLALWSLPAVTVSEGDAEGSGDSFLVGQVRSTFFRSEDQPGLARYAPTVTEVTGPHFWALLIALEVIVAAVLICLLLSLCIYPLGDFLSRHPLLGLALVLVSVVLIILLYPEDIIPLLLVLVTAVVLGSSFWLFRRMKRSDLP